MASTPSAPYPMNSCQRNDSRSAFTRVDLLALLFVLGLLVVISRPVWANGGDVRGMHCRDNLRRLSAAWLMFADDHEGRFVGNVTGFYASGPPPVPLYSPWVIGWLDWELRRDNTNTVYLTDPDHAHLAVYLGADASVYKCPADDYLSHIQGGAGWTQRVRSYSMNAYVGDGNASSGPVDVARVFYRSLGDFRGLRPADVFVLCEEHPDSINEGMFFEPNRSTRRWLDLPGSLHSRAGVFSFADGHVEQHQWVSPETVPPVKFTDTFKVTASPGDPDIAWMWEHTTENR